jgi:hypothetical protein
MTVYEHMMERVSPEPNSGCWLWMGAASAEGYGRIRARNGVRRMLGTHRLSWEHHFGLIPAGHHVCHKCDVPSCVNPQHLFLGTDLDNHRDKARKGRAAQKLTAADVIAMRKLAAEGRLSHEKISKLFGITQANASRIIRKASWTHIGD